MGSNPFRLDKIFGVNVRHFVSSFLTIKLRYKKAANGQTIPKKHRDKKDSGPSCAFTLIEARGTFHCPELLTACC
jgi:hypothetical protein